MARIRPYPTRLRPLAGFTLIELLLVVVIVGLLLAVSVPNIGRQINRDRANRSAMVVMGMLEEATQLAARRRTPVTVTLASGSLVIRDRATNAVLRQRNFGGGSDLRASVTLNPSTGIQIFPNGRATSGLRVTLVGGEHTAVVSRTATGILRRE